jgi:lipoprotein-anchoring transpeptidase ErfK/SrfK
MRLSTRRRRLSALGVAALLGLAAVLIVESDVAASGAASEYQSAKQRYDATLEKATQAGFTNDDLLPVTYRARQVESAGTPIWIGDRPDFYHRQARSLRELNEEVLTLQAKVLEDSRNKAATSLQEAARKISEDQKIGVDSVDLAPIQTALDKAAKTNVGARMLKEFRAVIRDAQAVIAQATQLGTAQAAENATVQKLAEDLKADQKSNPQAIRHNGQVALAGGRNDATVAAFLKIDAINRAYRAMERFAGALDSNDLNQLAVGTAGVQRYSTQIHEALAKAMPKHTIAVSVADQHLWAFQDGKVVMDTVVTTGRPALPTDIGPMKVLWKSSPWKMHSPWPKGSPYWYPDTMVRKVIWFTNTGEGLHDAPWRGWYGPGSNVGDGTHGCINLPGNTVDFLYGWADVGTPVIVYPGDGSPQADQIKRDTIDDPASANAPHGA